METIKKQDHCEPCEVLPVFENRSVSFFFVRSHVSWKVKEKIWGQKKVIFPIRSIVELSSWRQMAGWALVPPIDATVEVTRSKEQAHCCSQTRRSCLLEWAEGKSTQKESLAQIEKGIFTFIFKIIKMSFDPDSKEIRTTFFNKRGSIDKMRHFQLTWIRFSVRVNRDGRAHHDFFCHLCVVGSAVLLVNAVIVFVLLPCAKVYWVLGNVAGKICKPKQKTLRNCCYVHAISYDPFLYINNTLHTNVLLDM